jgi:hypothetical protein
MSMCPQQLNHILYEVAFNEAFKSENITQDIFGEKNCKQISIKLPNLTRNGTDKPRHLS